MPSIVTSKPGKRVALSGRVRWKSALGTAWRTLGNGSATSRPASTPARAVEAWLTGFASCVQRQAFDEGRAYFHSDIYCFGSYASACEGLDDLVNHQWRKIWPNITEFSFDLDELRYTVSRDGRWICAMVPWKSIGYRPDRTAFVRNGRLTVALTWMPRKGWQALHTHYSLNPGTAQTTVTS